MLELAQPGRGDEPLTAQVIAERRGIPEKYLVHILLQLKRAGLVQSVRGAQGGYRLADAPERVSVLDIIEAIDGPIEEQLPSHDSTSPELAAVWREASQALCNKLKASTLRQIVESAATEEMYYI
jgi:Rrf2 family cysteine metabolism transcriptional repressor